MCLFSYKEKKYGRTALFVFAIVMIALAVASAFGGVYAVLNMAHRSKYVIVSFAGIFALLFAILGFVSLILTFSMIRGWQSGRDVNSTKGVSNARLCDKCGRIISKHADYCEHCGEKQTTKRGLKNCPNCKTKNSGSASYCERCGYKF